MSRESGAVKAGKPSPVRHFSTDHREFKGASQTGIVSRVHHGLSRHRETRRETRHHLQCVCEIFFFSFFFSFSFRSHRGNTFLSLSFSLDGFTETADRSPFNCIAAWSVDAAVNCWIFQGRKRDFGIVVGSFSGTILCGKACL